MEPAPKLETVYLKVVGQVNYDLPFTVDWNKKKIFRNGPAAGTRYALYSGEGSNLIFSCWMPRGSFVRKENK